MRRGMTNSEVEKKKKGDVSRNAFTMPMLKASTLSILDSIVMFEYDYEVVVDDDGSARSGGSRPAPGESRLPAGKFRRNLDTRKVSSSKAIINHISRTTYGVCSNQRFQNLSSKTKQKNAENNPPEIRQKTPPPLLHLSKMLGKRKSSAPPPPPPKKRRKPVPTIEEIQFDASAREDYLTGFHKRKLQRIKNAKEEAAKKEREEKIEARKLVCSTVAASLIIVLVC